MNNETSIELQRLMTEAQNQSVAVATISGKKIVCNRLAQTRNGRRVESCYFRVDGNRTKFAELASRL